MEEYMMESGKMECFTAEENTHGQMDESMKANSKEIKNMDKVCISGLMVKSMMEVGSKVNNMVKLILPTQRAKPEKEDGTKANAKNG